MRKERLLPCWGRRWLAEKKEKESFELVTGEGGKPRKEKKQKDDITLPICTKESINYTIECITCREEGKTRIY